MVSARDVVNASDIKNRIGQSLYELAAPLFSQTERSILASKFHDIAQDCFRSHGPEQWRSELCADGTPLEFALALNDVGSMGLRYYIDPHGGPTSLEEAAESIKNLSSLFAPSTAFASNRLIRLSNQHLIDSERSPKTYFIHGLRFSPGQDCVYRIYFNTIWRRREDVLEILKEFLPPDDLIALASPSMATLPLFGVGYDVGEACLEKIKLYMLVDTGRKDCIAAMAGDALGDRAKEMETLMTMAFRQKESDWRMPRMLVTLGLLPESGDREVRLSLPCLMWEWDAFGMLEPVIDEILDQWRLPECFECPTENRTEQLPPWRFRPTHLSMGVSLKNESLSVYFQPARPTTIDKPLRSSSSSLPTDFELPASSTGTLADRSRIFRAMFDTLLNAEA